MPELDEENEHAKLTEPEASYKVIRDAWYVELVVPHPKDSLQPPQSMTMLVPSKWCARFITDAINKMPAEQWEEFANNSEIGFE